MTIEVNDLLARKAELFDRLGQLKAALDKTAGAYEEVVRLLPLAGPTFDTNQMQAAPVVQPELNVVALDPEADANKQEIPDGA